MPLIRRASCAALGAMLLASPAEAQQAKGFTYEYVQKTQTNNPMMMSAAMGDSITLRAKVQVDASGRTRMDIVEAARNPVWAVGDYMISGGTATLLVSPSRKEYFELGADGGGADINEMMKSTGMDVKTTDGKFVFDTLPETESLMGRPTRHYRLARDGTVEMNTPGGAMSVAVSTETDYFVVRERAPLANPFAAQSAVAVNPSSMISPLLAEKMRAVLAGMKGFPVRTVIKSTTNVMGMSIDVLQTMEVGELVEATVAPIPATPPAGYTKVTMASRMRAATGG